MDFGNGNGTFLFANQPILFFASWSSNANAVPRLGDFNGDQRTDVILTGVPTWASLPTAFSLSRSLP